MCWSGILHVDQWKPMDPGNLQHWTFSFPRHHRMVTRRMWRHLKAMDQNKQLSMLFLCEGWKLWSRLNWVLEPYRMVQQAGLRVGYPCTFIFIFSSFTSTFRTRDPQLV